MDELCEQILAAPLTLLHVRAILTWHSNLAPWQLGHGVPGYEPTPKKVTTAEIKGGLARGGWRGSRFRNVQVSTIESTPGSEGAGGAGRVGLLARVDAAADERDEEDDRVIAEEEKLDEEMKVLRKPTEAW